MSLGKRSQIDIKLKGNVDDEHDQYKKLEHKEEIAIKRLTTERTSDMTQDHDVDTVNPVDFVDNVGNVGNVDSVDHLGTAHLLNLEFPFACRPEIPYEKCFLLLQQSKLRILKNQSLSYLAEVRPPLYVRQLGLFLIEDSDYAYSNLTEQFCHLAKSQSRRHDMKYSPYEFWQRYKQRIVQAAIQVYPLYRSVPLLQESVDIQEQECCTRLIDLGGPSLFPACIAVNLIKLFNKQKILDISSGWGDRLLSACALDCEYWSCDPNPKLRSTYDNIIKSYGNVQKQIVLTAPFESDLALPPHQSFDLLLTSPPFFDLEVYDETQTSSTSSNAARDASGVASYTSMNSQSTDKYPDFHQWLNQFLFAALNKSNNYLASGAKICIHMVDVVRHMGKLRRRCSTPNFRSASNNTAFHALEEHRTFISETNACNAFNQISQHRSEHCYIVQPMIEYCQTQLKWSFDGMYGYTRVSADGTYKTHGKNNQAKAQPIWIFTKIK